MILLYFSPIRIIRAKVAEEVNSRLAVLGVDPLKNRLRKNVFLKQRLLLQEQHGEKSKVLKVIIMIVNKIIFNRYKNNIILLF